MHLITWQAVITLSAWAYSGSPYVGIVLAALLTSPWWDDDVERWLRR